MPDTTSNLSLPYILPAQAQKHVTHNEALQLLDVIVQLAVIARDLAVPPPSPAVGDRFIVAAGAGGVWAGKSAQIALFTDGAWQFFVPNIGWTAWIVDEEKVATFDGSVWSAQGTAPLSFDILGISAAADMTNRLSVSSPATLLNHAGAGHQLKLNKAVAGDTASVLFQTGFSGRAEMGIAGSDTFEIKVSADGAAYVTGLSIGGGDGQVTLPAALKLGGQATDPAVPVDGMIWLNTATGEIKMRSNGTSVAIAPAGGIADGDKGDITVAGGVWSVDAGAISNANLANVATSTLKGRGSAGTGAPEDLTAPQVASMLPTFTSSSKGVVPGSGGGADNFLRSDGTWASAASTLDSLGVTATAAQINGGLMPAGAVMHFAMALPPAGWLKAAGQLVSRSTYDSLFAAIGTTYGAGDGVTTFKLPDLRGEFVRGYDDARGVDVARVLGSAQLDAFQGHTFGDTDQPTFANLVAVNQRIATVTTNTAVSNVALTTATTDVNTAGSNAILRPTVQGTNGTPRIAAETRARNIALLACIKT